MEKINFKDVKIGDCIMATDTDNNIPWRHLVFVVDEIDYKEQVFSGKSSVGLDDNFNVVRMFVGVPMLILHISKNEKDRVKLFKLNEEEKMEKYTKNAVLGSL